MALSSIYNGYIVLRCLSFVKERHYSCRSSSDHLILEIMLWFAYPRLDFPVTASMTHLLRAPFSVNIQTGQVCVPISSTSGFNPETSPTIEQLTKESKKVDPREAENYNQTSLGPYVKLFEEFLVKLAKTWNLDAEVGVAGCGIGGTKNLATNRTFSPVVVEAKRTRNKKQIFVDDSSDDE